MNFRFFRIDKKGIFIKYYNIGIRIKIVINFLVKLIDSDIFLRDKYGNFGYRENEKMMVNYRRTAFLEAIDSLIKMKLYEYFLN